MKTEKQMGIWMDNSTAYLIELTNDSIVQQCILSEFTREDKEQSLRKSENLMHNKEKSMQLAYYKKISAVILNYDEVILFGPTKAKNELLNLLKDEHLFDKIRIEAKDADNMTESQMQDFVREYFK